MTVFSVHLLMIHPILSPNVALKIILAAERLGLPYLSAYLNAIEANFQHGADFSASGTIQHVDGNLYGSDLNPLSLDVQLLQFDDLKERTSGLYAQGCIEIYEDVF